MASAPPEDALTLLRAAMVLPVSRPAIRDGAVLVCGERILKVGRWRDLSLLRFDRAIDLGEVILLPGLVNAHCHLDYTDMAGQFTPPKVFTDWIKLITTTKGQWSYSEFAESWLNGAQMLVRSGTTTVGDIETVPDLLPDVWQATPLRVFSFFEMTGVRSRRVPKLILRETAKRIRRLRGAQGRVGLSPHAPYSTQPELIRLSARMARRRKWPMAIHVAESGQEFDMFMRGSGEMYDWLRRNERDMTDCGLGSPVQHLERCGALRKNLLAIHVNYLDAGDAALLAKRKVSVVHCPRSHWYFRHEPFPLDTLLRAGVNICLGTDSLASVYKRRRQTVELNLFEEMRTFAKVFRKVSPRTILQMVTVNAARALGLKGVVGELSPGAYADVIALPLTGSRRNLYASVLRHTGDVFASMIGGKWAIEPVQAR